MPRSANETWELFVLEYARSKDQPVASLIFGAHDGSVIDLPFSFVLARNGGRTVLIDTGFMADGGHGARMAADFGIPYWVSPLDLLGEVGVSADSVTDIVLSHAHFDHIGSIHMFPNARLYIQKSEYLSWYEALALPPQFAFLTQPINPDDIRSLFNASIEHRLTLLDGDIDDVLPGIHVRAGPGHTIGQQFIVVETGKGRIVVSGDCVYGARNIKGNDNNGVYVPLGLGIGSIWEQLTTMDRINKEIAGDAGRLVILHDFDRWKELELVKDVGGFRISRRA
jgi:glyoxylase-like metal-dependent hydrolase (beta-lactamase superfamily II)